MIRIAAAVLAVFAVIFSAPSHASDSVDVSLGGIVWYNWWKPAWSDGKSFFNLVAHNGITYRMDDISDFRTSSSFLAGPGISVCLFNKFDVSSIFVIGKYDYHTSGLVRAVYLKIPDMTLAGTLTDYNIYSRKVLKWDSDTTFAYLLTKNFKIFTGFKHQGYNYDEIFYNSDLLQAAQGNYGYLGRSLVNRMRGYGTGLGVGFNFPLAEGFYFILNFSGIVLWCSEDIDLKYSYRVSPGPDVRPFMVYFKEGKFTSYGTNTSASFSYYLDSLGTSVALGFRHQALYNKQKFNNNIYKNGVAMNMVDGKFDHFYGITMSVTYTFSIYGGTGTSGSGGGGGR